VPTTKAIVTASVVFHNLLKNTTARQAPTLLENHQKEAVKGCSSLAGAGNRGSERAMEIRNKFKDYLSWVNTVSWQEARVRPGCFGDKSN